MTDLELLLAPVTDAVEAAGRTLQKRFSTASRPGNMATLLSEINANDAAVTDDLRRLLLALLPGSSWIDDEEEGGPLPQGDWWVTDPAEGNVNHVHGRPQWGVSATLVRDGEPALTVVRLPMTNETFTATQGGGARLNGTPLSTSRKTELGAAIVATGQGKPGEDGDIYRRIGQAVTAMLNAALLVRMSVPSTLELVEVAAGRLDGFWQYSQVRSGLAGGALLVREAGGGVTDMSGSPWTLASTGFIAASPGIHGDIVRTLSPIA